MFCKVLKNLKTKIENGRIEKNIKVNIEKQKLKQRKTPTLTCFQEYLILFSGMF